jgi:hypothetical protein
MFIQMQFSFHKVTSFFHHSIVIGNAQQWGAQVIKKQQICTHAMVGYL